MRHLHNLLLADRCPSCGELPKLKIVPRFLGKMPDSRYRYMDVNELFCSCIKIELGDNQYIEWEI